MKKFDCVIASTKCVAISLMLCAFLAACGDDDSWSPSDADNTRSSSSVIPGSDPESSSAEKNKSSSSSADKEESSSSSVVLAVPCKTETEDNCEYDSLTDERDGQTYKTVKIGSQWWMAENLNYDDSTVTPSLSARSWCRDEVDKGCEVAGRLYTWAAAIDSVKLANDADNPQDCGNGRECGLTGKVQGICPSGWHLPSYDEWNALFTAVGGQPNAGKVLKSQTGWYGNGNGTDAFGFSALPAGYRNNNGYFDLDGYSAYFWSASENYSSYACSMYLYYSREDASLRNYYKYYGFSVRCLKD